MATLKEGDVCTDTGVWYPSENPNFYPLEYIQEVMEKNLTKGDIMPKTPHGEPGWYLID